MVLPSLTFIVDPTMNLMSGPHHECERREHHFTILQDYIRIFRIPQPCHLKLGKLNANTTINHIFKESYSSLSGNSFVIFYPSLLPLLYLERRFYPKIINIHSKCRELFWNLRSIGSLPN